MGKTLLRILGPLLTIAVTVVAFTALHHLLRHYHYRDIVANLRALPRGQIFLALGFTALSYFLLTLYDTLGVRNIGHPLPYHRIAMASFIGYSFNNNFGFAGLAGNSLRYRIYTTWGLSAVEVAKVIGFCIATFWLGFLVMAGFAFIIDPPAIPAELPLKISAIHLRPVGYLLLVPVLGYLAANALRKEPFQIGNWNFNLPPFIVSVTQIALACLDWSVAAAVFYCLLPAEVRASYPQTLGLFLLAQILGLVSHVPGGLGVFEAVMLYSLGGEPKVVGALLAYRGIYYLLPLGVAVVMLGTHEMVLKIEHVRRTVRLIGQWVPALIPNVFAFAIFVAGAILLVSGATPATHERLTFLTRHLPESLTEAAHLMASMTGAALLLLARGLQRRLDSAYVVTVALLTAAIPFSLLKGIDYEEATIILIVLVAFIPCRPHFYRKARLLTRYSISPGWAVAIALTIAGSIWIGIFSYKHVPYSHQLWIHFGERADAAKFMRASIGAVGVVALWGLRVLLRPAPLRAETLGEEGWRAVRAIVEASPRTYAWSALLRDKAILFNDERNAFIMYGIEGRSWVALGDPVGPDVERDELAWEFRELSDAHGGWTIFYHVTPENLPLYLDLGLVLLKLGEEAMVPLDKFTLEGKAHKNLRQSHHKAVNDGCRFEIVPPEAVPALLPRLRQISDAWLADKNTREKGFSIGFYSEDYLVTQPMALVRDKAGEVVAFANIWAGADKEELSIDMMRHLPEAHGGIMDFLFVELMLYGRNEGYKWFNLGMAPLSGLENRALAPLWTRIGGMIFRHGEHFYNFRGLRQYKEKFDPVWVPKYLATPGGIVLPRILTNIAALISRGVKGILGK